MSEKLFFIVQRKSPIVFFFLQSLLKIEYIMLFPLCFLDPILIPIPIPILFPVNAIYLDRNFYTKPRPTYQLSVKFVASTKANIYKIMTFVERMLP